MRDLYFFIGTEAEIMKMFMVIEKARDAGFVCKVVSSGQNDITDSPFLPLCHAQIDVDLSIYKPAGKNSGSYLKWFLRTLRLGGKHMRQLVETYPREQPPVMVVHGDTLSTLLGSIIAKRARIPHVHVEGGPRSYHWLNPFPEEIDRYFSSKGAEIIFCPGPDSADTARQTMRGEAVDTVYNTNIETLQYAYQTNAKRRSNRVYEGTYFVIALHRQENLMSRSFMNQAVESLQKLAQRMHGVFICHQQTTDALKRYGLFEKVLQDTNITVVPRMAYLDFIDTVDKAEFLAADGAGNQQEMFYMGKPYLILRGHIERESEGQGHNCIAFGNDFSLLERFDTEYVKYRQPQVVPEVLPSEIIVKKLLEYYGQ